jgi:hypothetical protein
MAWDSTKSTAADPDNPTADEQNPASEWNEMITYLKARMANPAIGDLDMDGFDFLKCDTIRDVSGDGLNFVDTQHSTVYFNFDPITGLHFGDNLFPMINNIYAIGSATKKLLAIYATTFYGTATNATDADTVDGCDAGLAYTNVFKIPDMADYGGIWYNGNTSLNYLNPSTDGYQLTTHGNDANATWAAASDLIFSDTHCPKCGKKFEDGDDLILHVIGHNEVGDLLTLPMHQSCAAEPKKAVTVKRKVMEDQYTLDELTGEPKVQRVQKMQEKTVTKHKMKEGYVLDNKSGKALKIDVDGRVGKTKHNLPGALETVEETITEVVYEDVEFEL